jgi:hypothetical protein
MRVGLVCFDIRRNLVPRPPKDLDGILVEVDSVDTTAFVVEVKTVGTSAEGVSAAVTTFAHVCQLLMPFSPPELRAGTY